MQNRTTGAQGARAMAVERLHAATAVYTRDPVVDRILSKVAWPAGERRLIEPSCGDGAFLVSAIRRLHAMEPNASPERVLGILEAYEVHEGAAREARERVAVELLAFPWPVGEAERVAGEMVRVADFLTEGPREAAYDVVAGNPPYLRFAHVPVELQEEYRGVIPVYARGDLLHAFLDACARVLRPEGEIAFVTADRWLINDGARELRRALGERFAIHACEPLDPSTAFYRPKVRRAGTPPRIHPVAVVLRKPEPGAAPLTSAAYYPGSALAAPEGTRLGDVARVRIAPWMGKDGIFILTREEAQGLPRGCLVPVVDTPEIVGGVLGPLERVAILTRPEVAPPPEVQEHLQRALPRMAARGRRSPWWLPPENAHTWDLSEECLVIPRIARSLRVVRVPAGVLPVNHNLTVVHAGRLGLTELEALLRGSEARAWVEARAPRVDNGYLSITTRLLRALPVNEAAPIARRLP